MFNVCKTLLGSHADASFLQTCDLAQVDITLNLMPLTAISNQNAVINRTKHFIIKLLFD